MKNRTFKWFKTFISLALCLFMSFGVVACSAPSGDEGDKTVIRIVVSDNAYGKDLLEDQAKRFNALHETDSYAEGKEGVKVKIEMPGTDVGIGQGIVNDGYHVIYTGDGYNPTDVSASKGWIANIDDIMTSNIEADGKSIEDKIPEAIRYRFRLDDSKDSAIPSGYYGLPSYEAYGGLSYDKDLFEKEGYFFAKPDAQVSDEDDDEIITTLFSSAVLGEGYDFKFTKDLGSRSVGPDGLPNTEDDGLPSSLYELIALCENLADNSIYPLAITNDPAFYINYFVEALYVSLLGYENGKALKDFYSTGVDVVVGYSDEDLFPGENGLEGVKKPITARVKIDEEFGYYLSHTVEKYYAFAFMQLAEQNEWYKEVTGAAATQYHFLSSVHRNKDRVGMLIENSYWANESRIRENYEDYEIFYGDKIPFAERETPWMSLPVNIFTSVDGTNQSVTTEIETIESKKGEPITLYIPDGGFVCVNSMYANDTEVMSVLKDWFHFIYSDEELSLFTTKANYGYMLNYEIKDEHTENAPVYTKSFAKLLNSANKVYPYGSSSVYKAHYTELGKHGGSTSYLFTDRSRNIRAFLKYHNFDIVKCFEAVTQDINDWSGFFGADGGQMPEAQYYPAGHQKEGQPIKYEGKDYSPN
ncbi:MAG: hypothetical protein E7347_00605 [Clostridiales bacterium]|nr:hypothetical protein [Clostridiales bacterium]